MTECRVSFARRFVTELQQFTFSNPWRRRCHTWMNYRGAEVHSRGRVGAAWNWNSFCKYLNSPQPSSTQITKISNEARVIEINACFAVNRPFKDMLVKVVWQIHSANTLPLSVAILWRPLGDCFSSWGRRSVWVVWRWRATDKGEICMMNGWNN